MSKFSSKTNVSPFPHLPISPSPFLPVSSSTKWDFVSLGEVMLRFDPNDERIHTARDFRVYEGGGEYNVARGLSRVFRQRSAIVTALADNALGRLAENLILAGGVDASEIVWRNADGRGENTRNGIYFIERGFGVRAPNSCFDRANTAVSQLKSGDIDWQKIFVELKTRWFHTGGVFTALSETTAEVAAEAMQIARENGAIVSYDLNYRDSLWRERGGREAANELNRKLLQFADVVFGVFDFDANFANYNEANFRVASEKMLKDFPNLKVIASSLREVKSASLHNLSGACFADGNIFKARNHLDVAVFDRVGSGDSFASGFIYALLEEKSFQYAIESAAAHSALAMTTAGDNSQATLAEVEKLISTNDAQAVR